jgi:hypothetical protein
MGLWPATMHENGLRCLSPVFSTGASPIFTAARDLPLFVFKKKQPAAAGFAEFTLSSFASLIL